jgi:serine phosphatase RsbU (regulator of sigma subunit)
MKHFWGATVSDSGRINTVLVVDDSPENIDLLGNALSQDYEIKVALSGEKALKIAGAEKPPDLILLDIMMPGMDGYEVCRRLKSNAKTQDIPVIFVTSMSEVEDEKKGLEVGAIDYITKPIRSRIVQARVKNHIELKEAREYLKNQNKILEQRVEERTREVLELQRVEFELRAAQEKVENELDIAAQIQRSILPSDFPAFPEHGEFDLYAMMIPAREVGGDFYDFFFVDEDHLAVIIADVSDKGVPAALFTMISRTIIRSIVRQHKSPSQVLTETNDLLCEGNDTGMFVTVFLAYYNLPTGQLTYSNGGHNPALSFGPEGVCNTLTRKHGPALGVKPGVTYQEDIETLETGQILVLYTDGVTEALSPQDELYGLDRFTRLVNRCEKLKLSQLFDHIDKDLKEFQQGNQFDDITVLALKRDVSSLNSSTKIYDTI